MTESVALRTHYGNLNLEVEPLPGCGRTVLRATQPHILLMRGRETEIPPGVMYVEDKQLARECGETHKLVRQGIYHLLRMFIHITRGSRAEQGELDVTLADVHACAQFILTSGCMSHNERRGIAAILARLERDLRYVRNARKDVGKSRIRQSHELFLSGNRRMIAPAAGVLSAGAGHHLRERISDLTNIHRFFGGRGIAVHSFIRGIQWRIQEVSRFLGPTSGQVPDEELGGLLLRLSHPDRGPDGLRLLRGQLVEQRASLDSIIIQPHYGLAMLATFKLDDMIEDVDQNDRERLGLHASELRQIIRRMRMIDFVEMELVSILSFYMERIPQSWRSPNDPEMQRFMWRLGQARARIGRFTPEECDPALKQWLFLRFETVESVTRSGDFSSAKNGLKGATRELASVSV